MSFVVGCNPTVSVWSNVSPADPVYLIKDTHIDLGSVTTVKRCTNILHVRLRFDDTIDASLFEFSSEVIAKEWEESFVRAWRAWLRK